MNSNLAKTPLGLPPTQILMVQSIGNCTQLRTAPRRVVDACLMAHAVLRGQGLTDVDFFNGEEQLCYALGWEKQVLGVLVWSEQEDGSWWTELGYVEPGARGQGIYTRLWQVCVQLAREAGVQRIQGGTAHSNTLMQRLMAQLGRKPHSIIYEYEVSDGA